MILNITSNEIEAINLKVRRMYSDMFRTNLMQSKQPFTEEELATFFNTLDAINNLPYQTRMFQGFELSDYQIPSFMKDYILPERVSFDASYGAVNFRKYLTVQGDVMTPVQLDSFVTRLLNSMRCDKTDRISIVRSQLIGVDAFGKEVVDGCVRSDITGLPLYCLEQFPVLWDEYEYNISFDRYLDSYFRNLNNQIRG